MPDDQSTTRMSPDVIKDVEVAYTVGYITSWPLSFGDFKVYSYLQALAWYNEGKPFHVFKKDIYANANVKLDRVNHHLQALADKGYISYQDSHRQKSPISVTVHMLPRMGSIKIVPKMGSIPDPTEIVPKMGSIPDPAEIVPKMGSISEAQPGPVMNHAETPGPDTPKPPQPVIQDYDKAFETLKAKVLSWSLPPNETMDENRKKSMNQLSKLYNEFKNDPQALACPALEAICLHLHHNHHMPSVRTELFYNNIKTQRAVSL